MSQCMEGVEGTAFPTALKYRARLILESSSYGGEGCLGTVQETETFTPASCPAFLQMN